MIKLHTMLRLLKGMLPLTLLLLIGLEATAQNDEHARLNMTLFDQINPVDTVGQHAACWGYTAPDGREYGLLGTRIGTYIIDITEKPIRIVSYIWGPHSSWREMKVYRNYAYIVTESGDSGNGLQIVDLSDLPRSAKLVRTDSSNFLRAHTCFINGRYLYAMGTQAAAGANGGAIIMDLEPDPLHPKRIGMVAPYYYHDAFERGDTLLGAAINGPGCDIYDVRDKAHPKHLATITYPYSGTHNAEITADGGYVVTSDEVGFTPKTMKVWDIRDLNNITKVAEYSPNLKEIVHNVHIRGRYAIVAWYSAGVRIIDMIDPRHPREVGFYDTFIPDWGGFNGVWDAYGFFPSGKVIAGDRTTGLYVLTFNGATAGSVSGVVRNATTGDPLRGATVVLGPSGTTVITDDEGRYYLGGANGQQVSLRAGLFGYASTVRDTTINDDIVLDINLEPVDFLSGMIHAVDVDGHPVSDFTYAVEPWLPSTGSIADSGALLLPRDSLFRVTVGKWGYRNIVLPVAITSNRQAFTAVLRPGYHDNATLELDWNYDAPDDDATTGRWVRIAPYLGYIGSEWFHPARQPDSAGVGRIFVTGKPPLAAPPQLGDVNLGQTTLTTPVMDLTLYQNPEIALDLWYVQYRRDTTVRDSLKLQLSNDNGASWRTIYTEIDGRAGWKHHTFRVADYLRISHVMLFRIRATDSLGVNLVNTAIDNFEVTGAPPSFAVPGDPTPSNTKITMRVTPNPAGRGAVVVELALHERHETLRLELFDTEGRMIGLLHDGPIEAGEKRFAIDTPLLPSGAYSVRWSDRAGGTGRVGFVVVR